MARFLEAVQAAGVVGVSWSAIDHITLHCITCLLNKEWEHHLGAIGRLILE
jgi:hypothetical protein